MAEEAADLMAVLVATSRRLFMIRAITPLMRLAAAVAFRSLTCAYRR